MKKKIIKLLNSKYLFFIILALIALLYLLNLNKFPIFADEAIYTNWAKRIAVGDEHAFISLFDGKPPLFIWITVFNYWVIKNVLIAGRLVSVVSIIITIIFLYYYIIKYYNNIYWAYLSVLFISLSSFIFFHGRLAIMDTLLACLMLMAILVWSESKIKYYWLWSGVLFGLAFWTKTTALFIFPLPIISILLKKNPDLLNLQKFNLLKYLKTNFNNFKYAIFTSIIATIVLLFLKISIWFNYIFTRSQDFSYSLSEVLNGNYLHIWYNFKNFIIWFIQYDNSVILFLFIIGIYIGFKKKNKLIVNLALGIILTILPLIILGKVIAPRYYLPIVIMILTISAYGVNFFIDKNYQIFWRGKSDLKNLLLGLILVGFITKSLLFSLTLINNALEINIPKHDLNQYLVDWSSGIGIRESAKFFNTQAQDHKILILTEGAFGTLPDGLFVELDKMSNWHNMTVMGVDHSHSKKFDQEVRNRQTDNIYYIGNKNRIDVDDWQYLTVIKEYSKVADGAPLLVCKVDIDKYLKE